MPKGIKGVFGATAMGALPGAVDLEQRKSSRYSPYKTELIKIFAGAEGVADQEEISRLNKELNKLEGFLPTKSKSELRTKADASISESDILKDPSFKKATPLGVEDPRYKKLLKNFKNKKRIQAYRDLLKFEIEKKKGEESETRIIRGEKGEQIGTRLAPKDFTAQELRDLVRIREGQRGRSAALKAKTTGKYKLEDIKVGEAIDDGNRILQEFTTLKEKETLTSAEKGILSFSVGFVQNIEDNIKTLTRLEGLKETKNTLLMKNDAITNIANIQKSYNKISKLVADTEKLFTGRLTKKGVGGMLNPAVNYLKLQANQYKHVANPPSAKELLDVKDVMLKRLKDAFALNYYKVDAFDKAPSDANNVFNLWLRAAAQMISGSGSAYIDYRPNPNVLLKKIGKETPEEL